MNLKDYMAQSGRSGITRLAEFVGVSVVTSHHWVSGKRQVPAERCPEIEKYTEGKVTCEELRPDVDWAVLRNSGK